MSASIRPVAIAHPATPQESSEARGKRLTRTELLRSQASARFDFACDRSGLSNVQIGNAWGVDERIVRDIRLGLRPLTAERLDASPVSIQRAYFQARLDELDDATPKSCAPVTVMVLMVHAAVGELSRETHEAMADGVIEEHELEKISKRAHHVCEVTRTIEMAPVSMRPRKP